LWIFRTCTRAHNGRYNTKEEFVRVLELIEKKNGKQAIQNMHITFLA